MDGHQKPKPRSENDNDLNDADIIDLNQIVEGGDDNNIIDLTNVLEKPDQTADAADEPDETVITLTDAIPEQEMVGVSEDTDDDVIDLLDMTAVDTPQKDGLASPSIDEAEGVIDLFEPVVDPVVDTAVDAVEPQAVDAEVMVDADDDAESSGLDLIDSDTVVETVQADAPVGDSLPAGDAIHATTLASVISPKAIPAAEPVPLTDQQVEDALERVIEKIYSEKIEHLMIQTIEKTVKREIEKIKDALLEDSDGVDR